VPVSSLPRLIIAVLGLIVGLGLFCGLFLWLIDQPVAWGAHWQNVSFMGFVGVFVLTFPLMAWGARKWAVLADLMHGAAGVEPRRGYFLRHYTWQSWIGQFIPPSLAIILGRGVVARQMGGDLRARDGFWSAFWDQGLEFAVLVGMMPASVLLLWGGEVGELFWFLLAAGVFLVLPVGYLFFFIFQKKILGRFYALFFLSVGRVFWLTLRLVVGSFALGLPFDPSLIVAAVPFVSCLSLLPFVPGNLGLAEWGWVGVMALGGADPALVAYYAIAFRLMSLLSQTILVAICEYKYSYRSSL
jgi:hypothetical protein